MEEIESSGVGMLTIEWEMMDKSRFFGLSLMNTISLRVLLYPLTVIKTRLQVCYYYFFPEINNRQFLFLCIFVASKIWARSI